MTSFYNRSGKARSRKKRYYCPKCCKVYFEYSGVHRCPLCLWGSILTYKTARERGLIDGVGAKAAPRAQPGHAATTSTTGYNT